MIDRNSPVTLDELHAYVDNELPAERRSAVDAWLAAHPEDAERVAEWRAQADAIRSRYGALVDEPVPARLNVERLIHARRRWGAIAAVACLTALLVGGAAGWFAHGASAAAPSALEILAAEALGAHRLYIAEVRHPIEVRAAEKHLLPWLSKRVGTNLRVPNLDAYSLKLLGGRLLPGPSGAAALFMYETPNGERVTLYCSRTEAPRTALRYSVLGQVAGVHWVESGFGYVVSGPADRAQLLKIAEAAYEQMELRPPERSTSIQLLSRRGS